MAAKKGKSGLPQARADLTAYHSGSSGGHVPVPTKLSKQKSLTNICMLTDSEKKMQLFQHKWSDDMIKTGAAQIKTSKPKDAQRGGTSWNGPLSKNISKSEHSLFQGKPKGFSPLVIPSNPGKASRIPRGPYAEVKPISKAGEEGEDSKSDHEIQPSKTKPNFRKAASSTSVAPGGCDGTSETEQGDKTFLKVDPKLVVTVLGDLEQLLFSRVRGK